MKFGILFLPTYVPELDGSEAQAYQNMLEQVDRAEALGFGARQFPGTSQCVSFRRCGIARTRPAW